MNKKGEEYIWYLIGFILLLLTVFAILYSTGGISAGLNAFKNIANLTIIPKV